MDLSNIYYIVGGVAVTLKYTVIAVGCGLVLGSLLALLKISTLKPLRYLSAAYTSIFRGTPLLVQLSLAYFALPMLTDYPITAFEAGVLAFSLNSSAYVSETIKAGILAVDKGQFEAALALGIPYRKMMVDIIWPQALRTILPSLVNEVIDMTKETAIISTIGVADIMRRANLVAAQQYTFLEPLLVAAGCYYLIVMLLTLLAKWLEQRMRYDRA